MFNSSKIAALQTQVETEKARADAAEAELAKLKAGISTVAGVAAAASEDEPKPEDAEGDKDEPGAEDNEEDMEPEASAQLASLTANVTKLAARVKTLEAATANFEKSIDARVSSVLASMGIEPIARVAGAANGNQEAPEASTLTGVKRLAAASKVRK